MYRLMTIFVLALTLSCAHKEQARPKLEERIVRAEARSLEDISRDTDEVLEHHPELEAETRLDLRNAIHDAISHLRKLKTREIKVIHVLIEKSLNPGLRDPKVLDTLREELQMIYTAKSSTLSDLIEEIREVTASSIVRPELMHDLEFIMREFR